MSKNETATVAVSATKWVVTHVKFGKLGVVSATNESRARHEAERNFVFPTAELTVTPERVETNDGRGIPATVAAAKAPAEGAKAPAKAPAAKPVAAKKPTTKAPETPATVAVTPEKATPAAAPTAPAKVPAPRPAAKKPVAAPAPAATQPAAVEPKAEKAAEPTTVATPAKAPAPKPTPKAAPKPEPKPEPKPATNGEKPLSKAAIATLTVLNASEGGLTRAEISEKTGINSGFTSLLGHLDAGKRESQSLAAKGFIEPVMEDRDGKDVVIWKITDAGKAALEAAVNAK